MSATIEITEFTDPACTWCWGSEPQLRKLEYFFGDDIRLGYVMGGLVEDANTFMDPRNRIGGDLRQFNKQVATHWVEASSRHGMPVRVDGFELFTETNRSTYPMNIAYKAAQFQGEQVANRFLRRMREAIATEARQANRLDVLIELAREAGLNIDSFAAAMGDGSAEVAFRSDRDIARNYAVRSFPSYLVGNRNGEKGLVRGYQTYEAFVDLIGMLSDFELTPVSREASEGNITGFIGHYGRATPKEIQVAFDLSEAAAEEILSSLVTCGILSAQKAGNGVFYSRAAEPVS
jgi:predicted DsbA family dithiol-disulfide isomerase